MNKIISCDIHDHFEIACMRRAKVTAVMHNAESHSGIAVDLETKNKREYLHLQKEGDQSVLKIDLLDIKTLQFDGDDTLIQVSSNAC